MSELIKCVQGRQLHVASCSYFRDDTLDHVQFVAKLDIIHAESDDIKQFDKFSEFGFAFELDRLGRSFELTHPAPGKAVGHRVLSRRADGSA